LQSDGDGNVKRRRAWIGNVDNVQGKRRLSRDWGQNQRDDTQEYSATETEVLCQGGAETLSHSMIHNDRNRDYLVSIIPRLSSSILSRLVAGSNGFIT
jgi:hypothetical protein